MTSANERLPSDPVHVLDYELEDAVVVSSSAQLKAIANETRSAILNLLSERAATVSKLAEVLGMPKGTVGYHTKVLEDAGLIRVVRTNQVRAMTEKYYGRTGRTVVFAKLPKPDDPLWLVNDSLKHMVIVPDKDFPMFTSRVARIPWNRAEEFKARIMELTEEFLEIPREGNTAFGFVAGVFPTDYPALPDSEDRA